MTGQPCDCLDLKDNFGMTTSGKYTIWPDKGDGKVEMEIYCDMDTDGGVWNVSKHLKSNLAQL